MIWGCDNDGELLSARFAGKAVLNGLGNPGARLTGVLNPQRQNEKGRAAILGNGLRQKCQHEQQHSDATSHGPPSETDRSFSQYRPGGPSCVSEKWTWRVE